MYGFGGDGFGWGNLGLLFDTGAQNNLETITDNVV